MATYVMALVIMLLCQAVITLRVWYLFSRSKYIRYGAVAMYGACTLSTALCAAFLFSTVKNELEAPNLFKSPSAVVAVYIPSLVIHTVLFGLKVYRFATSPTYYQSKTLLRRFLKEGGIMYMFASASLVWTITALSLTSPSQLGVYLAALQADLAVGATVVSVCRAMLSIRSLAATCHVDPEFLLNHAELSRVRWIKGAHDGEIWVESYGQESYEM
ncbi:hypothetical protein BJ138DRAFT_1133859 [Hygrophoropsis aurantiaca]|uniref:Uncharacterized protein n=1 Tax=Hygrophoropsis aurantiaca TaxID=72124 RepID=A0ACB8AKN4_9AGAM|nr:hypothetical protein BJ138DRAFT_1133859 [Hygrophoropsis aurantiaca]